VAKNRDERIKIAVRAIVNNLTSIIFALLLYIKDFTYYDS